VFLASSSLENQNVAKTFQTPLFQKYGPSPHEKSYFLLDMDFLVRDNKPHLKFHIKAVALFIYRMMLRLCVFGG
jgi:hypothetical protein